MPQTVTITDENGNQIEREIATGFAVEFPDTEPGVKYFPAVTREVVYTNQSNIAEVTDQCGNTRATAYGSQHNDMYEVTAGIADVEFTFGARSGDTEHKNLTAEKIVTEMNQGRLVKIYTNFTGAEAPKIQVTDVKLTDRAEDAEMQVIKPTGTGEKTFTGQAFQVEFQFGKEEEED